MLIKCHECYKDISNEADTCVHCGAYTYTHGRKKKRQRRKETFYGILFVCVIKTLSNEVIIWKIIEDNDCAIE